MENSELKALLKSKGIDSDAHNWLYSFMNSTFTPYGGPDIVTNIYLVAYCKQCDQTVSVQVPVAIDGTARLNRAHIPKKGCDWGEAS